MSSEASQELLKGGIVDITTTGRRTGEPRRIEIRIHNVDGALYLTGQPGVRGWYANMLAMPDFQIHLKHEFIADLYARATSVTSENERRRIHRVILEKIGKLEQLEERVSSSPLVHLTVSTK